MRRDNRKRYLERRERNKNNFASEPKKIEVPRRDNMGLFLSLMVVSFFIAILYIAIVSSLYMEIDSWRIIKLYCLLFAVGLCIPIKLYRKKLTMSFYEYILFNFMSFPLVLIALAFLLNNNVRSDSYVETHKIIRSTYNERNKSMIYELENDIYIDKEHLRTIHSNDFHKIKGETNLSLYFSDGLLGIRIIENKIVN